MRKLKIKENSKSKETVYSKKTVHIEGMMCSHCEETVKKTLESFHEIKSAEVSHENKTAVLTLDAPLDDSDIKEAIEKAGYKVISIQQ